MINIIDNTSLVSYILKLHSIFTRRPLMRLPTQNTVRQLLLPLFIVFVFCVGIANLATGLENQQLVIKLEVGIIPDSAEDKVLMAGILSGPAPREFPAYTSAISARLSTVIDSDAYPSSIIHGPPVPDYNV